MCYRMGGSNRIMMGFALWCGVPLAVMALGYVALFAWLDRQR